MGVVVREKIKGSGVWWIFVHHDGRRKARRVGDRATAKAVAREIRTRMAKQGFGLRDPSPPCELAESWLTRYPRIHPIAETTLENAASFTAQHLIPFFGPRPVSTITRETVEDFIAAKRSPGGSARFSDKPLANSSLRTGLLWLRLILEQAVPKYLPGNPARGVGRFSAQVEEGLDPFTPRELRAILDAAERQDPTFAAMARLWAQTGMRAGEVAALRWSDLDAERGVVVVRRSYTRGRIGPPRPGHPGRCRSFTRWGTTRRSGGRGRPLAHASS